MNATENTCPCGHPTTNYLCDQCADTIARLLGEVPFLDEQLEISATRAQGIDYRRVGGGKGGNVTAVSTGEVWKGERPDLGAHVQGDVGNTGAMKARGDLIHTLAKLVRFCNIHNIPSSSPYAGSPEHNPISMSRWLLWRVDGLTMNPVSPVVLREAQQAVAACYKAIDSPADKLFAGPCGAEVLEVTCTQDLWVTNLAGIVTCRTCGTTWDIAERRAWLLQTAEDQLAPAVDLAKAVSWLGAQPLTAERVRKWAERGRIIAKGHDTRGNPTYRVGDAIDLLAATTTRKAGA